MPESKTDTRIVSVDEGAGKRPYHAPQLRDFGHLQAVTRTSIAEGPYDSGGTGPAIYTS